MSSINRRQFVLGAGCLACAAVAGCASSGNPELEWNGPVTFDVGRATDVQPGIDARWAKSGGFFLVRQGNRVFALSATCTHRRCDLEANGAEIDCPCHGSRFTPAGQVLTGPATRSLPRFGISQNPEGRLTVDRTRVFDPTQADQPGAYVTV